MLSTGGPPGAGMSRYEGPPFVPRHTRANRTSCDTWMFAADDVPERLVRFVTDFKDPVSLPLALGEKAEVQ
jgi:hypothetical protein